MTAETRILLLRGINVGGPARSLPMKELKGMLEELGATNVQTYIQSGNVVLNIAREKASGLPQLLAYKINEAKGFCPSILLLTLDQFNDAISKNPFPDAEEVPKLLHVGFLASNPKNPDLDTLRTLLTDGEKIKLIDTFFYHFAANGYGRSKVAEKAERLLGVAMTDRNWNTVKKLQSMAEEASRL